MPLSPFLRRNPVFCAKRSLHCIVSETCVRKTVRGGLGRGVGRLPVGKRPCLPLPENSIIIREGQAPPLRE